MDSERDGLDIRFDTQLQKELLIVNNVVDDLGLAVNDLYLAPVALQGPIKILSKENCGEKCHKSRSKSSKSSKSSGSCTKCTKKSSKKTKKTKKGKKKHHKRCVCRVDVSPPLNAPPLKKPEGGRAHTPPALSVVGGTEVCRNLCVGGKVHIKSSAKPKMGRNACKSPSGRCAALVCDGGASFSENVLICESENVDCDSPLKRGGLRVIGGVGVGKSLGVGQDVCVGNNVKIAGSDLATCGDEQTPATGALTTIGGVSVGTNLVVCSTDSANCTTGLGSVVTNGGIYVGQNVVANGNLSFNAGCGCNNLLNAVGYPNNTLLGACNTIAIQSGTGTFADGSAIVTFNPPFSAPPVVTANNTSLALPIQVIATPTNATFNNAADNNNNFNWMAIGPVCCVVP